MSDTTSDRAASLRAAIAKGEAELAEMSEATKKAYRVYREADDTQTAKAIEVKVLRRELRELETGKPAT